MDYVGFAEDTTQTMLAHLRTQPIFLNEDKQVLRRDFFRPWSDSPNMNLQDFARELDKRQRKTEKQNFTIDDNNKVVHLVGCAQVSGLFKAKWVGKWEVTLNCMWSVVRDLWVAKWKMVTRASDIAEIRGGYEFAAALRAGATSNPEAPASSATSVTRANYDAVAEYAAALKAENLEFRSIEADRALTVSSLPDTVAAATTSSTTAAVIAEIKRALEVQATVHTTQIAQLTALITAAAAVKAPSPAPAPGRGGRVFMNPAGTRCVCHPPSKGAMTTGTDRNRRAIRTCSSCTKNWVTHADDVCFELPKNADKLRADWKSYFM